MGSWEGAFECPLIFRRVVPIYSMTTSPQRRANHRSASRIAMARIARLVRAHSSGESFLPILPMDLFRGGGAMRRVSFGLVGCGLVSLLASCSWIDSAKFADFRTEGGLEMTQGGPPEGSKPISTIYASRSGWYLFSLIPIVSAELPDAMKLFVEEAQRHGADGVSNIKVEIRLSSFFTAWSQSVALYGE